MKRRTILTSVVLATLIISTIGVIQLSTAASRKDLLGEFCAKNYFFTGGFTDTNNASVKDTLTDIDEFTSYANAYILSIVDSDLSLIMDSDIDTAQSWANDRFVSFAEFESQKIVDAVYAYQYGLIMGYSFNSSVIDEAVSQIYSQQNETTFGFAGKNETSPTVIDTYFALYFLNITDNAQLINIDDVASFIMSSWDNSSKLFAGTPSETGNIADTLYAIKSLKILNKLDLLSSADKNAISTYIESKYVNNSVYKDYFGGYSVDQDQVYSSITFTYYCVEIQSELGGTLHDETVNWLLNRQNPSDYGFQDVSLTGTIQKSSAKLSYYAVKSMLTIDGNAFGNGNAVMNQEIWDLSTNGWIVAGIWVGVVAVLALIGFGIYKYKNRI